MNKKSLIMAMLAVFLFQTQTMAASSDVEREILSGTAQTSVPRKDKDAKPYRVIWAREEGDEVEMSPADREREILGNSQRSVSVPTDSETKKKKLEKKKKDKKAKAEAEAKQSPENKDPVNQSAKEPNQENDMHSSSLAWDKPNPSKNPSEKVAEESVKENDKVEENVKENDKNEANKPADKKVEKKKKVKKEKVVSQNDWEREILGGKAQRSVRVSQSMDMDE